MTTLDLFRNLTPGRRLRRAASMACLAGTLALAGCGGGGEMVVVAPAGLQVGVVAGPVTYAPALHGQVLDVVAQVGQPIVLDATEPVVWSFSVDGSAAFMNGTTVDLGGVSITQIQLTDSQAELFSTFYGPALLPIEVWMTATSTLDAAEVVTIRLLLQ